MFAMRISVCQEKIVNVCSTFKIVFKKIQFFEALTEVEIPKWLSDNDLQISKKISGNL